MNAIILAAGYGTRLGALTNVMPKPLIEIAGEPIIERQIRYLREINVEDIYIVTGYLHNQFEYLHKKYNVNLLFNPEFSRYNNIYSLYVANKYFGNSYILEGDVFIVKNILSKSHTISTYYGGHRNECKNEWILEYNSDYRIINILPPIHKFLDTEISLSKNIIAGISYWTEESAQIIKSALIEKIDLLQKDQNCFVKDYFWDHLVIQNIEKLDIKIKIIKANDWYEIDTLEDYAFIVSKMKNMIAKSL